MPKKWPLLMLMPLAACAPGPSERISMTQVAAACDDRALASFIGQAPTKEVALNLMGYSRSASLRWVPFGSVATTDHDPKRLTVHLDQNGRIASTRCG